MEENPSRNVGGKDAGAEKGMNAAQNLSVVSLTKCKVAKAPWVAVFISIPMPIPISIPVSIPVPYTWLENIQSSPDRVERGREDPLAVASWHSEILDRRAGGAAGQH